MMVNVIAGEVVRSVGHDSHITLQFRIMVRSRSNLRYIRLYFNPGTSLVSTPMTPPTLLSRASLVQCGTMTPHFPGEMQSSKKRKSFCYDATVEEKWLPSLYTSDKWRLNVFIQCSNSHYSNNCIHNPLTQQFTLIHLFTILLPFYYSLWNLWIKQY